MSSQQTLRLCAKTIGGMLQEYTRQAWQKSVVIVQQGCQFVDTELRRLKGQEAHRREVGAVRFQKRFELLTWIVVFENQAKKLKSRKPLCFLRFQSLRNYPTPVLQHRRNIGRLRKLIRHLREPHCTSILEPVYVLNKTSVQRHIFDVRTRWSHEAMHTRIERIAILFIIERPTSGLHFVSPVIKGQIASVASHDAFAEEHCSHQWKQHVFFGSERVVVVGVRPERDGGHLERTVFQLKAN